MAARTALMVVGALAAVIAVYPMVTTITGLPVLMAVLVVLTLAVAVAVTHGPGGLGEKPADGIVDCTGESLRIGDTVRAGAGFDGPMELGFGRGVVVKVGHGKAHVRFNDIPEQVHPITPGTLRRLA
jgi:hypothetical protein